MSGQEHYSNKGGHWERSKKKARQEFEKKNGGNFLRPEQWDARRSMMRNPQSGKRSRNH